MKPVNPFSVPSNQSAPTAERPSNLLSSPGVFDAVASVTCEHCQTDEYLVYERVNQVIDQSMDMPVWSVECWCGKCEQFYALSTTEQPEWNFRCLQPRSTLDLY